MLVVFSPIFVADKNKYNFIASLKTGMNYLFYSKSFQYYLNKSNKIYSTKQQK